MNIIIFGSTRGIGRHMVEQALAGGHNVTAAARNATSLADIKHNNLKIVVADVTDPVSIERALPGHDAVLSAIGSPDKKDNIRSAGTLNVIRAMEKAGIKRLISVSTVGAGDSHAMLPFLYKFILVPLILKRVFDDHTVQEEYLQKSNLDWTVLRPGALTDSELTGKYRNGVSLAEKGLKFKISRADVADFAIRELGEAKYVKKMPWVSY